MVYEYYIKTCLQGTLMRKKPPRSDYFLRTISYIWFEGDGPQDDLLSDLDGQNSIISMYTISMLVITYYLNV